MMDEKVIDGILCYRNKDGGWTPYTIEALTIAFIAMRGAHQRAHALVTRLEKHLQAIRDEVLDPEKARIKRLAEAYPGDGTNFKG